MTNRIVTDQFWSDNIGPLVSIAKQALSQPPAILATEAEKNAYAQLRVTSLLIIAIADLKGEMLDKQMPRIVVPS